MIFDGHNIYRRDFQPSSSLHFVDTSHSLLSAHLSNQPVADRKFTKPSANRLIGSVDASATFCGYSCVGEYGDHDSKIVDDVPSTPAAKSHQKRSSILQRRVSAAIKTF